MKNFAYLCAADGALGAAGIIQKYTPINIL